MPTKEKLPRIPTPRRKKSEATESPAAPSSPSLDHIAEGLRPLAVPIGDLAFDPANARTHDERNVTTIAASLRVYGQRKPVVCNRKTGAVEAGNGTLQAALSLGWTHLAAVYVDDDAATAAGFSIADNRSAELAGWDAAALDKLLREVSTGNDPDLDRMMSELAEAEGVVDLTDPKQPDGPEPQIDRADEMQQKWNTASGQLWEVQSVSVPGKCHRLLCGDSTKAEDVARVMGGERAGLMNTDPPYGVAYSDAARVAAERAHGRPQRQEKWRDGIENDTVDGEKLQGFLEECIRAAVPRLWDNAAFYLWHPMLTQGTFFAAAADILIHRQIIWVKPSLLFGFGDYHWQHELCFYGWRRGHRPAFLGERNQTTIWDMRTETPSADRMHPTQKPVELFTRPMRNHLKPGEIAYEPFAGSGSQFVAGEQLGRLVYGIEIEPRYCAVVLQRMADMGLTPRLVE